MKNLLARFVREEEGQDLVEYIFLVGFIALLVTVGLTQFSTAVNTKFQSLGTDVENAGS
jgi:Flp pilus assembly pilin Flp